MDLHEVWDADWLVEIKSADNLLYLVDDFIHAQSALKLSAFISHKFDPPSKQTMSPATLLWCKATGIGGGCVRARIIGALAKLRALCKDDPPRSEVAFFVGYRNAASKGFSHPVSAMRTEGIVEYRDKKSVSLTKRIYSQS